MAWGTIALWTALSPLISGGAAAGASVYGSKKASSSARRAADVQGQSAERVAEIEAQAAREAAEAQERQFQESIRLQREQLEWERELERQARGDWEAREARLQPYRNISSRLMGRPMSEVGSSRPMPTGWRRGAATGGVPSAQGAAAPAGAATMILPPHGRSLAEIATNPMLLESTGLEAGAGAPEEVAMPSGGVMVPDPMTGEWVLAPPPSSVSQMSVPVDRSWGNYHPGYQGPWSRGGRVVFPGRDMPQPEAPSPEALAAAAEAWRRRYQPRTIQPPPRLPLGYAAAAGQGRPIRPARRLSQVGSR